MSSREGSLGLRREDCPAVGLLQQLHQVVRRRLRGGILEALLQAGADCPLTAQVAAELGRGWIDHLTPCVPSSRLPLRDLGACKPSAEKTPVQRFGIVDCSAPSHQRSALEHHALLQAG